MLRTFMASKSYFLERIGTILLVLSFLKENLAHFKNSTLLKIVTMQGIRKKNIKMTSYYCLKAREGVSEITKFKRTNFLNSSQVSKNILSIILKSKSF